MVQAAHRAFIRTSYNARMEPHKIVLIQGDGIGPEVAAATLKVLEKAEAPLTWERHEAGVAALALGKDVMPKATIEAIQQHGIALKGPCTTPVGEGFSSVNVSLRKRLDLYAAVRPVRSLPGVATRFRTHVSGARGIGIVCAGRC